MIKRIISFMVFICLVTSCATQSDENINYSFDRVIKSHNTEQTRQVAAKTNGVVKLASRLECTEDTAACGTINSLVFVVGSREISEIKPQEFTQKRSRTGLDVQERIVEGVEKISPYGFNAIVSAIAIEKDKGSVKNTASGGSTAASDYDEDHATGIDTDSPVTNSPDDSIDNSKKEEIAHE